MQPTTPSKLAFDEFLSLVDRTLIKRSGAVFYSGRSAFATPVHLYVLGLNPGGSPVTKAKDTIERDIQELTKREPEWSAYLDSWQGKPPGTCGIQPRVLHMLRALGLDPRRVPASNVVFVRSRAEAGLRAEKADLLPKCWKVHQAVIDGLNIRTVLCLGRTAGAWVRESLGAHQLVGSFVERNARRWRTEAHLAPSGRCVITATHPGRADWRNPVADPTPLVKQVLQRER